jgi:hypothetical protein
LENENDLNDLIKIFMYRFVRTKDKSMKTQKICFKIILSKMATIVRFVQVKTICQCGVYTDVGINYLLAKNKKQKEPDIDTLFGKYCTGNPFINELMPMPFTANMNL